MAVYTDITEIEKSMHEAECKAEASSDYQTDNNMVTDENQHPEITGNTPAEELSRLLEEKMILHEKGKEVKKIVCDILEENLEIIGKMKNQENTLEVERNKKHAADLIRNRLSALLAHCKKVQVYFKSVLDSKRSNFRNICMLTGKDEVASEEKLARSESMLTSFNEQVSKIEVLLKPDYGIVCQEDEDCFNIVMRECDKVEEIWNKLMSVLYDV